MNAPAQSTFLWHDYETFGADTRYDRPAEFACWRTDASFEPVAEPGQQVERAIALSKEKYCSASIMLGATADITTSPRQTISPISPISAGLPSPRSTATSTPERGYPTEPSTASSAHPPSGPR